MVFGNMTGGEGNQTIVQFLLSSTMGLTTSNPPGSYLAAVGLIIIGFIIGYIVHFQIFEW